MQRDKITDKIYNQNTSSERLLSRLSITLRNTHSKYLKSPGKEEWIWQFSFCPLSKYIFYTPATDIAKTLSTLLVLMLLFYFTSAAFWYWHNSYQHRSEAHWNGNSIFHICSNRVTRRKTLRCRRKRGKEKTSASPPRTRRLYRNCTRRRHGILPSLARMSWQTLHHCARDMQFGNQNVTVHIPPNPFSRQRRL